MADLLYVIKANTPKEEILAALKAHPEIKFVSLVGIDLAGNDTDEKIPISLFLKDIDEFYAGTAVQTDGITRQHTYQAQYQRKHKIVFLTQLSQCLDTRKAL